MTIDESLYEYLGDCPVRKFIPRKPHPNGLEAFALACYIRVGESLIPVVLDLEPYMLGNEIAPQEAMILLHSRLRQRFPFLTPSLVVDSAFGSFDRMMEIINAGGRATMSMSAQVKPWLWKMLNWDCGLDEGRVALLSQHNIAIASFQVETEAHNLHQIKIISSACEIERNEDEEVIVLNVTDRREYRGKLEYLAHFSDGSEEWLSSKHFIDDDGTANLSWLDFARANDLNSAFSAYTQPQLKGNPHSLIIYSKLHIIMY
jgi:hypothetical protein